MDKNKELKEGLLDGFVHFINEATGSSGAGSFKMPLIIGLRRWEKDKLSPFTDKLTPFTSPELDYDILDGELDVSPDTAREMEKIARQKSNSAKKINPNMYISDSMEERVKNILREELKKKEVEEDLGVWFGTKKKPKGSNQPKGPWVNICRKKEGGGHPPCGRPDAESKGYPKCRAIHVASKMTDAQKKAACSQKRRAEKKEPKSGTGNKPTMTSYKPKKK